MSLPTTGYLRVASYEDFRGGPRAVARCFFIDTRSTQEQKASTSAAQTASRRLRGLRAHVTVIVGVPAHQLGVTPRCALELMLRAHSGQPDGSVNKDFNSLSSNHELPTPGRAGQTGCYTR